MKPGKCDMETYDSYLMYLVRLALAKHGRDLLDITLPDPANYKYQTLNDVPKELIYSPEDDLVLKYAYVNDVYSLAVAEVDVDIMLAIGVLQLIGSIIETKQITCSQCGKPYAIAPDPTTRSFNPEQFKKDAFSFFKDLQQLIETAGTACYCKSCIEDILNEPDPWEQHLYTAYRDENGKLQTIIVV